MNYNKAPCGADTSQGQWLRQLATPLCKDKSPSFFQQPWPHAKGLAFLDLSPPYSCLSKRLSTVFKLQHLFLWVPKKEGLLSCLPNSSDLGSKKTGQKQAQGVSRQRCCVCFLGRLSGRCGGKAPRGKRNVSGGSQLFIVMQYFIYSVH